MITNNQVLVVKVKNTTDEIRQNALAQFLVHRIEAVTRKDYQVESIITTKYGGGCKAFCQPDGELDNNSPSSILTDKDSLEEFVGLVQELVNEKTSEKEIKDKIVTYLGV